MKKSIVVFGANGFIGTNLARYVVNNNLTSKNIETKRFQESIKDFKVGKDVLSGKMVDLKGQFTLEAQSVLVLELE